MISMSETLRGDALPPEEVAVRREEAIERIGNKDLYVEIARYFASHLEDSLKNLADALGRADTPSAARLAHSLKSNCATVGADILCEQCRTLENLCREGRLDPAKSLYESIVPKLLALRGALTDL
jgi:two-component system sensor histidine kinase BarA